MQVQVKNRFTGATQFTAEIETDSAERGVHLGLAIKWAVSNRAILSDAVLSGADLSGAHLSGAYLHGAYLHGAVLRHADLSGADLRCAVLSGAVLSAAYLRGAVLSGADLSGADLRCADLSGADLSDADLRGADLRGADLRGAKGLEQTIIAPEGSLIGWKKLQGGVIAKLRIPETAKRSNATGRKCRAEFAEVLELSKGTVGKSQYNPTFVYRVGETVRCDLWCEDRWQECAGGIHFFLTRVEAEAY